MIAIGRMHIGPVLPEWLSAWEALKKPVNPDGSAGWVTFQSVRQVVHSGRNEIVKGVLRDAPNATHLFFIDDDVTLPADGLVRLLSHADAPVVSGLYIQRGEPYLPVAYRRTPAGHYVHITRFADDDLQEIDGCGGGCLLIRTDVLRAIEATGEPWFDWSMNMSEDLAFCRRAQQLGYRIALDPSVKCAHLTVSEVTYEVFAERRARGMAFDSDEIERLSSEVVPWESASEPVETPV